MPRRPARDRHRDRHACACGWLQPAGRRVHPRAADRSQPSAPTSAIAACTICKARARYIEDGPGRELSRASDSGCMRWNSRQPAMRSACAGCCAATRIRTSRSGLRCCRARVATGYTSEAARRPRWSSASSELGLKRIVAITRPGQPRLDAHPAAARHALGAHGALHRRRRIAPVRCREPRAQRSDLSVASVASRICADRIVDAGDGSLVVPAETFPVLRPRPAAAPRQRAGSGCGSIADRSRITST